ncbi:MAG: hypothetical protein GX556_11220 [Fibrobacter sp.]|nr:hypothetical protein [Fibrobacter sp.]
MIYRKLIIAICLLMVSSFSVKGQIAKFDGFGVYLLGGLSFKSTTNDEDGVLFRDQGYYWSPEARDENKFTCGVETYLGFSFFYMLATEFGYSFDIVNPNIDKVRYNQSYFNIDDWEWIKGGMADSLRAISYRNFYTRFVLKVPRLDKVFRPFYSLHFGRYKEWDGLFQGNKLEWKINWSTGAYFLPDFPVSVRVDLKHYNYNFPMYKDANNDFKAKVGTYALSWTLILQKLNDK